MYPNSETMQDGSPAEEAQESPEQEQQEQGMGENELCVPLSVLAMPGEDDAMENPAQGDKGQANIEYTVNRIQGSNAYVTIDAVNGNKLEAAPGGVATGEPSEEDQLAQLQDMAGKQPTRY